MKDPHDKTEYKKIDVADAEAPVTAETIADIETPPERSTPGKKRRKFSGAYYYVDVDEKKLSEAAFIRTLLTVIAVLLQIVVLLLPQGSLEYVTNNIPSYAYAYMWLVFVMLGISIWIIIMNMTRYKFKKRIPMEYAPRNGFTHRAFFGAELFIAANAVITVLELSFVCIHYDGIGLTAMFICILATAAAVAARQVTHITLKNATLIEAPDEQKDPDDDQVADDKK